MKKKKLAAGKKVKKNIPVTQVTQSPAGIDKILHFILTRLCSFFRYFFVFLLGMVVTIVVIATTLALMYVHRISMTSTIPVATLFEILMQSKNASVDAGTQTILILGTDALTNRDTDSKLTDTIMLLMINPDRGKIDTFSIPRDLWIASQSSKVNGLYGKDGELPRKVVGGVIGQPINDQVIIDIVTVGKMIDALGGLDILVERSFVDYRFPRSDVDVRVVRDDSKLYETVAFTKGVEHMSGDRALRYIRSRHSLDPVEGTDDARIRRQQQVIAAILSKVKDPMLIRNPEQIGAILKIYTHDVQTTFSLEKGGVLAWQLIERKKFPVFVPHQFAIKEVDTNGVLTHPERFPGGAWVYLPVDPTFNQLHTTVATWLKE